MPLLAAVDQHRVRADGEYDDVGRGGVHLGREADDDDRHQPDHEAAARPLSQIAHNRAFLQAAPRATRQRRPAVAGRSIRLCYEASSTYAIVSARMVVSVEAC